MSDKLKEIDNISPRAWEKAATFTLAMSLVDQILENHKLSDYSLSQALFTSTAKVTAAEQNIDHIIRVADWLLE